MSGVTREKPARQRILKFARAPALRPVRWVDTPAALLLLLILLEAALAAAMMVTGRVPSAHDAVQYFHFQYYFLNGSAGTGQVPQWIPFMTHGTLGTWWYATEAGLLQNVLFLAGTLLAGANLLYAYHLGLFVDSLLLLVGLWLLGRRYFSSPVSAFFVCATVLGSSIWASQTWWNFHLFYALPLVIELGHRFIDGGRWRHFFLAGNLLALQTLGNLPYFIPVVTLFLAVYFATHLLAERESARAFLRRVRWRLPALAALTGVAASLFVAYHVLAAGTDQIAPMAIGREADGRVSVDNYLTYGGELGPAKWLDLLLGVSPMVEYTLFIGGLALPMIVAGCLTASRRSLPWIAAAVVVQMLSAVGAFSLVCYYGWPGMQYFRHLGLVCPLVKLCLCVIAGFGFDWFFANASGDAWVTLRRRIGAPLALGTLFAGAFVFAVAHSRYFWQVIRPLSSIPWSWHDPLKERPVLYTGMVTASGFLVIVAILLAVRSQPAAGAHPRRVARLALAAALLAAGQMYTYKFRQTLYRTVATPESARWLTRATPLPFVPRRLASRGEGNERSRQTDRMLGLHGGGLWSAQSFAFLDTLAHEQVRTDNWLRPFDKLLSALSPGGPSRRPHSGNRIGGLQLSAGDRPGILKVTGVTRDKVQFFSVAFAADDGAVTDVLRDPAFGGDLLFIAADSAADSAAGQPPVRLEVWAGQAPVSDDRSLPLRYRVESFTPDSLQLTVWNDTPAPVWLTYTDTWHPAWHADVNGEPAPVFRANLAYKAVAVPPGQAVVRLRFSLPLLRAYMIMISTSALYWLSFLIVSIVQEFRPPSQTPVAGVGGADELFTDTYR